MQRTKLVYLNGEFLPADQATVSVLDRGFIFGDGVYEVIPCYGGYLFRLREHLERLDANLVAIRIAPPLSHEKWQHVLQELVASNGGGDQSVYLQITRGVAPRDHAFPARTKPTVLAMSNPLQPLPSELLAKGISAITLDDFRWQQCNIKAIALLPNILARQQALDVGAGEAIFVRDGAVTEGAASNVFLVKNREITTPPKGPYLLPGITRDLVLELAAENQIRNHESTIRLDDLEQGDEIWLTSSTKEIVPVTQLNGKPVGAGRPGPLWARMLTVFQDYKQRFRSGGYEAS